MRGLIIWAQSTCRSTMGVYAEIAKMLKVPVVIALWHQSTSDNDIRTVVGLNPNEFGYLPTTFVGEDISRGIQLLNQHRGFAHLFAVYQGSKVWRKLICEAKRRGEFVMVGGEAPCNMSSGFRFVLKEIYLRCILPYKVRSVVKCADKFINFSGDDDHYAKIIGWKQAKIIPFGYFPPPLTQSNFRAREASKPFNILSSGLLTRYRGGDVIVEALRLLKARKVEYRATITQTGELLDGLKKKAAEYSLPIEFPGFITMEELIHRYETCSVYVAAGRHEPWGMRLNDALNCGAPLVISRGMGGVKMVDDYGCGLAFKNGDAHDLADKLEMLATSPTVYSEICAHVAEASRACSPNAKAKEMISFIEYNQQVV